MNITVKTAIRRLSEEEFINLSHNLTTSLLLIRWKNAHNVSDAQLAELLRLQDVRQVRDVLRGDLSVIKLLEGQTIPDLVMGIIFTKPITPTSF